MKATRQELDEADLLDTVLGQQAVTLATKMVSPFETGSALAAVSREFRAVMARVEDARPAFSLLDEIHARRDAKRRQAMGTAP